MAGMGTESFRGWPSDALAFFEELAADNTKVWWHANKQRYEAHVKEPMMLLADEVRDEFGPLHIFRPFRDTRFSKDKTPYKTHTGAVTESEGGAAYYIQIGADGLSVGGGYYHMASDQLEKYRVAVADVEGEVFAAIVDAQRRLGCTIGGEALKTAPRGYAKDHPRIELLRHKGIYALRHYPPAKWMSTRGALDRVAGSWRACAPFLGWLDTHVGPSELPPEQGW